MPKIPTRQRSAAILLLAMLGATALAGCSDSAPDITGNWRADDGSGTKVISANGMCSGMYYSQGKPLDIGGGMSCSFSTKKGSDGKYSLVVSQPPNQTSYAVSFDGNDKATVYQGSNKLFSMTRM